MHFKKKKVLSVLLAMVSSSSAFLVWHWLHEEAFGFPAVYEWVLKIDRTTMSLFLEGWSSRQAALDLPQRDFLVLCLPQSVHIVLGSVLLYKGTA